MSRPRIYLAGDTVFRPDAAAVFDRQRKMCSAAGLEGLAPLDGQAELARMPPGEATIMAIVRADRDLMDSCAGGLFCLDPFRRGADMDPGTAVEIGYMLAAGKTLCGHTSDGRPYPEKVRAYFAAAWNAPLRQRAAANQVAGGASGTQEDADGVLVHSEGMLQNGMTEGFIRLSGGRVFSNPDGFVAFAQAAALLASLLGSAACSSA